MARPRPSRVSNGRVLRELRTAARKGDRAALTLAVEQMRVLALSPRYWEKYLALLGNPLARLVDLLVIKQGERIAQQKGWKKLAGGRRAFMKMEGAAAAPSKPPRSPGVPHPSPSKPPRSPGVPPPSPSKPPRPREGRRPSPRQGRRSNGRPRPPRRAAPSSAEQQLLFELPPRA
ncbi:MAG: hypothetical protein ACRDH5_01880 [bacterium]